MSALVIRLREGRVEAVVASWSGARELSVVLDEAPDATPARALAYPALVGEPAVGERVLVNTSAVSLGLGTGGYHLVVAVLGRSDALRAEDDLAGPGHLVKARYTPLQAVVLGVCSINQKGWPSLRPRIRSWVSAILACDVSSGG